MAPRAPRITAAELLRALRQDGWLEARQSGSHLTLVHAGKPGAVVLSRHAGRTIGPGLLARTLKDAGLTMDELRRLL